MQRRFRTVLTCRDSLFTLIVLAGGLYLLSFLVTLPSAKVTNVETTLKWHVM